MKLYVYSGTHWDREWYQCFQGFRYRLVEMADGLCDGLERRDDYGIFHFDGQTIVLEDIIEIAPDLRERLKKQIQSGRVKIGPWYCMPDEFIISGESLIRNLQIGHKISREWGAEPSKEGYICDIFGHIAQMPQIFAGMDIHHSVLGRGTNEDKLPMFFNWRSPDGTGVIVYKLDDAHGYGDFTEVAARTTGPACGAKVDDVAAYIKPYCDERIANANIPVVMFLDALDHNNWHEDTPVYCDALKKLYPDAEVYHTDVMDMCAEAEKYKSELPVKEGELNETAKKPGGYVHLITNVLSSRYPIKKANDLCQTNLEKIVAPLYAYGKAKSRKGFLELAQKYLIMNHPHDSICGCSIDQVHRDMMYRFDQSKLLCNEIMARVNDSIRNGSIEAPVSADENPRDVTVLRLYNPLPYRVTETVETEIHFPKNYNKYYEPFGYEGICSFRLYDCDGNEVPYGIKDIEVHGGEDIYRISFIASLNPSGLCDYEVRPSDKPSRYLSKMSSSAVSAENEYIAVKVNADGSVALTDKKRGVTYPQLLTFVDDGEIGDGWFHCNPAIDRQISSSLVNVEKCEDSVNACTFRINLVLHVPEECLRNTLGTRRSEKYVDVSAVNYVTLYRNEEYLTVKTIIDNCAKDHRIKLRLDTGIEGGRYYASQAFAFVERDTDIDTDTADWKEASVAEKATEGTVVKYGADGNGLAFVSKYGLHECAVYGNGIMDITFLRCYCKTVGTEGEPDGELIGRHEFEYLIVPTAKSETSNAALQLREDLFRTGVLAVTTGAKSGQKYAGGLDIISDTFRFTTANILDDGMEFRMFNCSDAEGSGTVVLPTGISEAYLTEIDGRIIRPLEITDGRISLTLGKWKIATVRCR